MHSIPHALASISTLKVLLNLLPVCILFSATQAYPEASPLPEFRPPASRSYVTPLHHQDRDMGPHPVTEIELPERTKTDPRVWHYITPLHRRDREMGPSPWTVIELPMAESGVPGLWRYITPLHRQDREMGPAPYTEIDLAP